MELEGERREGGVAVGGMEVGRGGIFPGFKRGLWRGD
jgi:hypothetical protein